MLPITPTPLRAVFRVTLNGFWRSRRGFTLVELLVVIGIIALLIGILMPALSRARAQSKSVNCLANLRTLGQCYFEYIAENKGRGLFLAVQTAPPDGATSCNTFWFAANINYPGTGYTWDVSQGYLTKYYKKTEFLNCPSSSDAYKGYSAAGNGTVPLTSYAYNANIASLTTTTKIRNAAQTCALMDAIAFANDTSGTLTGIYAMLAPSLNTSSGAIINKTPSVHGRHSGKASVLWYDGHATSETPYVTTLASNLSTGSAWATPAGMAAMRREKIGYLTPLTPTSIPESQLFVDFPNNNLSYYFWANKSDRK